MTDLQPVRVDADRLDAYIQQLGRLGRTASDGLFRFQYDDSWQAARELLLQLIDDAGLDSRVDAVGNVYGRLRGDDERVILTGSHVDTVPSGGCYDGALGIVGGLAALAALREMGTPRRTVEVVALCEEESSRFAANFFGTRAILGLVGSDEPDQLVDDGGTSLAQAMERADLDPSAIPSAARTDIDAFLELHIEQGRVLQDHGLDIGLVDVIPGITWETVRVVGRQDHAGATPMDLRADALQAAAEISRRATSLVESWGRPAVITMGRWSVKPGWPSIVPGSVEFSVDLRHPDGRKRRELIAALDDIYRSVGTDRGVEVSVTREKDEEPAHMDAGLIDVCRDAAERHGASWHRMHSGAGHDSQLMATRLPTAMLFVPSVDGKSHRPDEFTELTDCVRGASVLATALYDLAYR